jgi:hypothetical protein
MHTSQTDPMSRFNPGNMGANPFAASLGGAAMARGVRPGTKIRFPGSRQQSAMTPGFSGMRRRRS